MKEALGFLRADGERLANDGGSDVLLRGVGLGGWLLPEGYMWRLPAMGDRPRRIEQMIRELIGDDGAKEFWRLCFDRYISEADLQQISAEGFNSVRVPINARFLLEEGEQFEPIEPHWQLLDRLIGWCRARRLYAILDLHGAPGGQTGSNIDDSQRDEPELFTDAGNRRRTIELWRMLAERYRREWAVAGYDLLNEPLPRQHSALYGELMPLYQGIIAAIREVDDRHIIILEGAHWATDWSVFTEKLDRNLMLQFHKYWNNPDTESITAFLEKRREWNVPIFMGEAGENSTDWYVGAFALCEDHRISWNFWTWKKMATTNSPCSVRAPSRWQRFADLLQGGSRPSRHEAQQILWEFLENIAFDRCEYHPEVVRSIFRRPPVRIPAVFYGFKGAGVDFAVRRRTDRSEGFRCRDGTDIRSLDGTRAAQDFPHKQGEDWQPEDRLCVRLEAGDWLAYEVDIGPTGASSAVAVSLRISSPSGAASILLSIDGASAAMFQASGGSWETATVSSIGSLQPGRHRVVLATQAGSVCIEWLEIRPC